LATSLVCPRIVRATGVGLGFGVVGAEVAVEGDVVGGTVFGPSVAAAGTGGVGEVPLCRVGEQAVTMTASTSTIVLAPIVEQYAGVQRRRTSRSE
jgi:hypothetical protein